MVGLKGYHRPKTVRQAVNLLKKHGKQARLIAGGTDLMVLLRAGTATPQHVVSINAIPGMKKVGFSARNGLSIGPLVTYRDLMDSPVVRERYPVLIQAASVVGATQVQNTGTIVGNLCHASPSADTAPPLLALGAQVEISAARGKRTVDLTKFFRGPNKTVLKGDEIVTGLLVPAPQPASAACFFKHGIRSQLEISMVSVAAYLTIEDGKVATARIALGAVSPTPMRATQAENVLLGKTLNDKRIGQAAAAASKECKPITDFRCSAEYRREMIEVFTRRAINEAAKVAQAS